MSIMTSQTFNLFLICDYIKDSISKGYNKNIKLLLDICCVAPRA